MHFTSRNENQAAHLIASQANISSSVPRNYMVPPLFLAAQLKEDAVLCNIVNDYLLAETVSNDTMFCYDTMAASDPMASNASLLASEPMVGNDSMACFAALAASENSVCNAYMVASDLMLCNTADCTADNVAHVCNIASASASLCCRACCHAFLTARKAERYK
ncbi:hypothetical protein FRX31_025961 [Thalictrum thalictroides]|uniref:RNase H type-1 domain-containing protein n=1 Tax=Thalictrum thalictroides TaxID=46969 RepID=A0A7J6VHT5_THATH|nr:hypothetical protein FRX31_025961 [Thalictrum thalictroides]